MSILHPTEGMVLIALLFHCIAAEEQASFYIGLNFRIAAAVTQKSTALSVTA